MIHLKAILDTAKNCTHYDDDDESVEFEVFFFISTVTIRTSNVNKLWVWNEYVLQPYIPPAGKGIKSKRTDDWKPSPYTHL